MSRSCATPTLGHGCLPDLRIAAMLLLLAIEGCAVRVPGNERPAPAENGCSESAACGPDAACRDGKCMAIAGAIDDVTFEVIPDETATFGGGLSFLLERHGLAQGDPSLKLQLPQVGRLALGPVTPPDGASSTSGCTYDEATGTLAAHVQLTRIDGPSAASAATLGIDSEFRSAQPNPGSAPNGAQPASGTWAFALLGLAPGTYDLYAAPSGGGACGVAPLLLHGVPINPGDTTLALALPPARTIGAVVNPPAGTSLEGWTADVIEPQHGLVISNVGILGASSPTNFNLSYRPVEMVTAQPAASGSTLLGISGDAAGVPYLRISPPASVIAPTVYWSLSIDIDGDGTVALDMSNLVIAAVHVTGTVQGEDRSGNSVGVGATLTLLSSSLDGAPPGLTASYGATVQTASDGTFSVDLLPGRYRAIAFPSFAGAAAPGSTAWSITEHEWTIGPQGASHLVFALSPESALEGVVTVPFSNDPLARAPVDATPLDTDTTSVLRSAQAKGPVLPRAATATTAPDGSFALSVDTGDFSIAIEPPDGWGWPWLVLPSVHVDSGSGSSWVSRRTLSVPLPVEAAGYIVDPDGVPVGGAVVRAYASPGGGAPAVKVGETHTNMNGAYHLLLPARFEP